MNDLVSIVVPVYNAEKYLDKSLQSCFDQTYQNIEIIAVNDGSTDSSLEILNSYADRIRIISQKNKGVAGAINTGIRNMKSNWYKLLDADDILYPNCVEILTSEIEKVNDKKTIIFGNYDFINSKGEIVDEKVEINRNNWDLFHQNVDLLGYCFVNSDTAIMHKETFTKYGFYNETYRHSEDYEMFLNLCLIHGFRLHIIEKKLAMYRIHPQQNSKMRIKKYPNYVVELRKTILQKLDSKERKKYETAYKDYIKTNQPSIGKRTKTKIDKFILRKMSPTTAKKN